MIAAMRDDPARLLDSLYAGVTEDPPWLVFLRRLQEALPCAFATIVLRQPSARDAGTLIGPDAAGEGARTYREGYYDQSPLNDLADGVVHTLRTMFGEAELQAMAWYRGCVENFGTHDLIAVNVRDPGGLTLRLRGARQAGQPLFAEADRAWLQRLVPSLKTALALYAELEAQRVQIGLYELAAGHLGIASAILNEEGDLIHLNNAGRRILESGDGLARRGRHVAALDAEGDAALQAGIRRALAGRSGEPVICRRAEGLLPWSVLAEPVRGGARGDASARAAVMLLIRGPAPATATPAALLRDLFDLTAAEANLALRLMAGDTLNDAAGQLGISRNTARVHLAAIFSKTYVGRQAELVRLLIQATGHMWRI